MSRPRSTPDANEIGPTERQPSESSPAYEAFRTYLLLGPRRSTASVARELGKSKTLMDRWCSRWSWVVRVREFESEVAKAQDAEHLDALQARAKRQAEVARMHGEASVVVAREVLRRYGDPEDARVELEKLSAQELLVLEGTLARAHSRVVVTERLALGMTTTQGAEPMERTQAAEMAVRLTDDELESKLTGFDELAPKRAERERKAAS
jgi:hypothetical protein